MGFYGSLMMLAGSVGPATAGVIADATGERRWASGMVALAALGAAAAVVGVARETAAERGPTPPGAGV
jgi:cyanate permease